MSNVTHIDREAIADDRTSDELVAALTRVGRVNIFQYDHSLEWCAWIELNIKLPGMTAEIKAGGGGESCRTMRAALSLLESRVRQAIAETRRELDKL